MNPNNVAGLISTIALLVPILLILWYKLYYNTSLLALLFSYAFSFVYNLMTLKLLTVTTGVKKVFSVASNYLDVPLMLLALLFFCVDGARKKIIYITLAAYLLYEAVILFYFRLQPDSSTYVLGPGTLIILTYSIYFFKHYGKITIVHGKSVGKTFMLVSLLFSYGCFAIIYFLYYIQRTPAVADVFLIYYIVTFIAAVLMIIGLVWVCKRTRQIEEIQLARKELALFFEN